MARGRGLMSIIHRILGIAERHAGGGHKPTGHGPTSGKKSTPKKGGRRLP